MRIRSGRILRKSQERLRTLLDINNAIVTKLTREELFTAIAEVLARVIKFDRIALSIYDPQSDVLRIVTYAGSYRRDDYTPLGRVLDLNDSTGRLGVLASKASGAKRSRSGAADFFRGTRLWTRL